jgi:hypothetical protein
MLTITAAAALTAADDTRVRRGLALPFGAVGRTSAGPVRAAGGGRVGWPADLRRVKVFSDHGRLAPIGYVTALEETPDGVTVAFRLADTPAGAAALLEVDEGVRDAISVELDDVTLAADGLIEAAQIVAIALVPLPAFTDARIAASFTPTERTAVTTVTVTTPPPAPTDPAPTPDPAPAPAPTPTPDPAPTPAPPTTLNAARTAGRPLDLRSAVATLEAAWNRSRTVEAINAALADVVPANDAPGGGILTPQWLGELWTPYAVSRNYVNSVQSGTLTGMHLFGYRWTTPPVVGPYAGNKTEIPSNAVQLGPVTADAYRLAGGWDVDRIFYDLGAPGFLKVILDKATEDLRNKQEAHLGATLKAAATTVAGAPADLFAALSLLAAELGKIGAAPTSVAVASDLYGALMAIPASAAPWWLSQGGSSIDVVNQTAVVNGNRQFVDPTLPAGTVMAWDRRAATYYEAAGTPIRVQAVNIPNGGIDVGVFSYQGEIVNDARAIVDTVVVPPVVVP